jgi:hypothetical protein
MLVKTLRKCFGLGILVTMGSSVSWSRETPPPSVQVTVAVHDDAGLSLETVVRAEEVSSRVFREAGIKLRWLNCSFEGEPTHVAQDCAVAVFPTNLQLRILGGWRKLRPDALGVSYLSKDGSGCYSEIFVEPEEQIRKTTSLTVGPELLLGYAASHEIAHLLLGTNSHSGVGIMRAHWNIQDLVRAAEGTLAFNPQEGLAMRARVAAAARDNGELTKAAGRMDVSGKD